MKAKLTEGDRVELLEMPNDPDPIPVGTKGTIVGFTEFSDEVIYYVNWDNGRTLNLCGIDRWRKL